MHNYQWLPQLSLSALSYVDNNRSIIKRIDDAIKNSENSEISNRLGIKCDFGWAQEILIHLREDIEELSFSVYPGNTKGQGYHIFKGKGEPNFRKTLLINGVDRELNKNYHIKFSGQSYITGLWAGEKDFKTALYTTSNFHNHSGRKKRTLHWSTIESLLDNSFKVEYDWKKYCKWNKKLIKSNRSQFDISYGYEISFRIPYKELQQLDTNKNDLKPLITLIDEIKERFKTILLD